jgi:tetraspanin-18
MALCSICCLPAFLLKCVIGIINGVFLLIGLLLCAAGGILLALANNASFSTFLLNIIKDILRTIAVINGSKATDVSQIDFIGILRPAGIAILLVGLFIAAIAIIGYCGLSCYDIILKVYLVILIVILVVMIVLTAIFFSHALDGHIKDGAMWVLREQYVDIDDFSFYSIVPNIIMIGVECCGVNDYKDFWNATKWNNTREIVDYDGKPIVVPLVTPIACCKTNGTFPEVKAVDQYCAYRPNNDTSNMDRGCWDETWRFINIYRTYAILVACAIILVQFLLIVGISIIICNNDK